MGCKARESVEAMCLAFVLLDFQHAGVRRRAYCMRWSVDMQQFREVSRTRTIYSTETHTSNFILWKRMHKVQNCTSHKINYGNTCSQLHVFMILSNHTVTHTFQIYTHTSKKEEKKRKKKGGKRCFISWISTTS